MTGVTPTGPGHSPSGLSPVARSQAEPSVPNAASAVADKLDEARALIERGWIQRRFRAEAWQEHAYCATGAIIEAGTPGLVSEMHLALERAIGVRTYSGVWNWNDAPGRTQAEVIDAFRRAAELARAGEL